MLPGKGSPLPTGLASRALRAMATVAIACGRRHVFQKLEAPKEHLRGRLILSPARQLRASVFVFILESFDRLFDVLLHKTFVLAALVGCVGVDEQTALLIAEPILEAHTDG